MASRKRPIDDGDTDSIGASSSQKRHTSNILCRDFEEYVAFFSIAPRPLSEVFDNLKQRHRPVNVPSCVKSFETFTKDVLPFSLQDVNWSKDLPFTLESERMAVDTIEKAQRKLLQFADEMETDDFLHDKFQKRLFMTWFEKVFSFLCETKEILEKLNVRSRSSSSQGPNLKETVFTHLFMKFTEIFFLKPEVGDLSETKMTIQNKTVGCIPDMKYCEHTYRGTQANLLALLIQMQRDVLTEPSDEDVVCKETWLGQRLDQQILQKIGMELVAESSYSSFAPDTLGIIVMRTEIIFLILEMKRDQWAAIHKGENVEGKCADLHYTESFDIVKESDRNKVLEFLFWLGCLQKHDLQKHFLLQ